MDMRRAIKVVEAADASQALYEMASLPPHQTGLSFAVWVSPRGGAKHDARIKVTAPPYGANPEAIYQVRPFGFVEGQRWLNSSQEIELAAWVALNEKPLIDFWDGRIHYEDDLKAKLVHTGDAPPGNQREAVATLRSNAPKVKAIRWHDGAYHLFFDQFSPDPAKLSKRLVELDLDLPFRLHLSGSGEPEEGILLWPRIGS